MLYLLLFATCLTLHSFSFLNEYNQVKLLNRRYIILSISENNEGNDMRYSKIEEKDIDKILEISENINKRNVLRKLENNKISMNEKLLLINLNYIFNDNYSPNITSGGLFDDFNYTF